MTDRKIPDADEPRGIRCPRCGGNRWKITHTQKLPMGRVRRYRDCLDCGCTVATYEITFQISSHEAARLGRGLLMALLGPEPDADR